jgi:uncharacterized protein involved in exopolysaccharide biosynthesis
MQIHQGDSMSRNFASIPVEPSVGEVLPAALGVLWRRKLVVLAVAAVAIALGIVATQVMPPRYTAEAYIRGELAAPGPTKEDETVSAGAISLDLIRLIETQSRLLQSHRVARKVVEEVGIERLRPIAASGLWLPASLSGGSGAPQEDEADIVASKLLGKLSVLSDPVSYLIRVQYTAGDSELATLVANAFVAELLRSTKLQMLVQRRAAAQALLVRKLAKFGEKHPDVLLARTRVATADDLLKKQLNEGPDAILQSAGENVTRAIASPSNPNPPFVVALFLVLGLTLGAAGVLWRDRKSWWA